jgi:hypothetical protein
MATTEELIAKGEVSFATPSTDKVTTEVLPGISLVRYPSGYTALRIKGKGWGGKRVNIGRPLYRRELESLIECLQAEVTHAVTYEEAHGQETVPF